MRFSYKLSIFLFLIIFAAVLTSSVVYYYTTAHALSEMAKNRAEENVSNIMDKFERFMFERIQDSKVVASSPLFKEEPLNLKRIAKRLIDYRNHWRTYLAISFCDANGTKLIDTSGIGIGRSHGNRLFFKEALSKGESAASEVDISFAEKIPVAYFASRVYGKKGQVLGVVSLKVPLYKIQYLVEKSVEWQRLQKARFPIDLIDGKNRIIFSSRKGVKAMKDIFEEQSVLDMVNSGAKKGVTKEHKDHGEMGSHFCVFAVEAGHLDYKGNGWTVILWVPERYIEGPLKELRAKTFLIVIFALLLAGVFSVLLGRQISRPIEEFSKAAEKMGKGRYDTSIAYKSNDEFGMLASSFNRMADEIRSQKKKSDEQFEMLQKSEAELRQLSGSLEEKVKEKTKDIMNTQEAILNILDDAEDGRKKLEASNIDLVKAKTELEEFSKGLEKKVAERTFEMEVLYDISNSISYSLDYAVIIKLIMEALAKTVYHDISCTMLYAGTSVEFFNAYAGPAFGKYMDEAKEKMFNSLSSRAGENVKDKKLKEYWVELSGMEKRPQQEINEGQVSFIESPFVASGRVVGILRLIKYTKRGFSDNDQKLLATIASIASNALERLQLILSEEKTKLNSMIESMTEGALMADNRGEIVVINTKAREILGFKADETVTGAMWSQKADEFGVSEVFVESKAENRFFAQEVKNPNNPAQILRFEISPVSDQKSMPIGIAVIFRDITAEIEKDKMKDDFISTVSHELRTPLTIIRESVSQIMEGLIGEVNREQAEYLHVTIMQIDRLRRIIDGLLSISKYEAGKEEVKKENTDIVQIAKGVCLYFNRKIKNKGLILKEAFPPAEIILPVDKDKIIQVFTNLVDNAIKFTNEGEIIVSVADRKDMVECFVADTGKGIAKEDLQKTFTKFEQFGRTYGPGEKGTGLGLAICKKIIEMHGGKIWAESALNEGSKFIFTLPKGS